MTTATRTEKPADSSVVSARWDATRMREAAAGTCENVLRLAESAPSGLTEEEAQLRLEKYGPNEIAAHRAESWAMRLFHALRNPLVVLLATLAAVSLATGDARAATVMVLMIILGVALRFVQESRANTAAEALRAMIKVTATVQRGGARREVPLREIVPGDVIVLTAGDMIPGDVRLLTAKDLFVIQSALTGESLPSEKGEFVNGVTDRPPTEAPNVCFLGTSVESGSATAVV